jgi:hypothetical protein
VGAVSPAAAVFFRQSLLHNKNSSAAATFLILLKLRVASEFAGRKVLKT